MTIPHDCDRRIPVLASARWGTYQGKDFAPPSPSLPAGTQVEATFSSRKLSSQAQARAFSPPGRTSPVDPGLDAGSTGKWRST
jgi:hypothetical protein